MTLSPAVLARQIEAHGRVCDLVTMVLSDGFGTGAPNGEVIGPAVRALGHVDALHAVIAAVGIITGMLRAVAEEDDVDPAEYLLAIRAAAKDMA